MECLIVTGYYARLNGLYKEAKFVLDAHEKSYDDGIWLMPLHEKVYAKWFYDFNELYDYLDFIEGNDDEEEDEDGEEEDEDG